MIKKFTNFLNKPLIFRQLLESVSSTYTYILGDILSKTCVIIDPVLETVERDLKLIEELNLKLLYAVNTHMHADHISGTKKIKHINTHAKSVISKSSGALADIYLKDNDKIYFGQEFILAKSTPGHTDGCMTFISHKHKLAFTGDTLLIRGCGRTDFQSGNPETLYDSIYNLIFSLPEDYFLYPAHDYKGMMVSTVGEEKRFNPRLTKSKTEFVNIMNNLNLPYPKKIDIAVPANKLCGAYELPK